MNMKLHFLLVWSVLVYCNCSSAVRGVKKAQRTTINHEHYHLLEKHPSLKKLKKLHSLKSHSNSSTTSNQLFVRNLLPRQSAVKECKTQVDLGFLIDGSGSVNHYGAGNFDRCLEFVKSLTRAFVISSTDTRVGAIVFSSRSQLQFDFNQYTSHEDVEAAIDRIPYPGYRTNTGVGLKLSGEKLFNDVRPGVPRVLVVITDGASTDDVAAPSEALRQTGVIIISVGLGIERRLARFKPQLTAMASEPKQEHVFTADFPQMQDIVTAIQDKLCQAATKAVEEGTTEGPIAAAPVVTDNPLKETEVPSTLLT
ncbi:vitrin-like [Oculina patagonica]